MLKENIFASAIIEITTDQKVITTNQKVITTDQKVITTGPYSIVRHPMYLGGLIILFGVLLALGSWWGLLLLIPFALIFIIRLLDEEKLLSKNLPGYDEYHQKVRYRLIPLLW
ncbi:isoprenylcysteine carboxylmethyltransferase family protein [Methanosarcina sp. WH1]|uniref:methyltransferase family protein n=1 Tax=Methanosarcina sp. WH1 TaxID=1434102 RepID=UPI000A6E9BAF|nr:isoprenylcysteine carboxylmethyltransferase family protein [Methanosarcina sp. WH1]